MPPIQRAILLTLACAELFWLAQPVIAKFGPGTPTAQLSQSVPGQWLPKSLQFSAVDGDRARCGVEVNVLHLAPVASMFEHIQADMRRYYKPGAPFIARTRALLSHGFIATLVYRYGRWTRRVQPRLLGLVLRLPYYPMAWLRDWFAGINISTNADIGPGLYIAHYGAIFLHGHMGANCSVGQCVTIGFKGANKSTNPPRLGNNVYVGTSAVIVGDITIGDDVIIGANTTVVKDVPARHRVVSAAVRVEKLEPDV